MKHFIFLFALFIFNSSIAKEVDPPDTVTVGIYVTSVHDIDFKAKQYTVNLWLWLKYKRPEFDFEKHLEVPMAKSFEKSYSSVDTLEDGSIYMLMKLQCIMKDSWKIKYFPFDYQKLRFTIENSEYDASELVFAADTVGKHFSKWTSSGWIIPPDSFKITTGIKKYETGFGDPELTEPNSDFSVFRVTIGIQRESWELFFKLFLGMYLSFMISYSCFYIHADNIDSRFGLSVGSLFAIIGNKYIIDSSLPESTSFTLVDTLHGFTLAFVFCVVVCSILALKLVKKNKLEESKRFDIIAANTLLLLYIAINAFFIFRAWHSYAMPA